MSFLTAMILILTPRGALALISCQTQGSFRSRTTSSPMISVSGPMGRPFTLTRPPTTTSLRTTSSINGPGKTVRSSTTAAAILYRPMTLTRPATSIQTAALDPTWPLSGAVPLLTPFLPRPEIKVKAIGTLNTLRMRSMPISQPVLM